MKKLRNRRGEMLIESLISMVIIAMTGMMLAMAAASVLRANVQADQTVTFVDTAAATSTYPENSDGQFKATLGGIDMGNVTVKEQGGLYYYEANP